LVVSDSNGCFTPDSVTLEVNIGDFIGGVVQPTTAICPGESYQLEAYGGSTYLWSPAQFLDDPTSPTPYAVIDVTTLFTVIVSDSCGIDTVQCTLPVIPFQPTVSNDTSLCIGNSTILSVSEGILFSWTPTLGLDDPTLQSPTATPDVSTTYVVEIESIEGCIVFDTVIVAVYYNPPVPVIPDIVPLCLGSSVTINVSGADEFFWSPNANISTLTGSTVIVSPSFDMYYYCDFLNACGSVSDSVWIDVIVPAITAGNDTTVCPGDMAYLWANGAQSYSWTPASSIVGTPFSANVSVQPLVNTGYFVSGTDQFVCVATESVQVNLFPVPFIQASPDVYAFYGDEIILSAESSTSGTYIWSPAEILSCVSCANPSTSPNQNTTILVSYTDENGCTASDSVKIFYDPVLFIPNTFTPDGNEHNNEFRVVGGNISSFELMIFNRWGELLYTITSFDDFWDGTYKGRMCQDGTYTWKIRYYRFDTDEVFEQTGHVNLIR
jgi:gliding motility-associated-like protein